jgi:hypothetical protein
LVDCFTLSASFCVRLSQSVYHSLSIILTSLLCWPSITCCHSCCPDFHLCLCLCLILRVLLLRRTTPLSAFLSIFRISSKQASTPCALHLLSRRNKVIIKLPTSFTLTAHPNRYLHPSITRLGWSTQQTSADFFFFLSFFCPLLLAGFVSVGGVLLPSFLPSLLTFLPPSAP